MSPCNHVQVREPDPYLGASLFETVLQTLEVLSLALAGSTGSDSVGFALALNLSLDVRLKLCFSGIG